MTSETIPGSKKNIILPNIKSHKFKFLDIFSMESFSISILYDKLYYLFLFSILTLPFEIEELIYNFLNSYIFSKSKQFEWEATEDSTFYHRRNGMFTTMTIEPSSKKTKSSTHKKPKRNINLIVHILFKTSFLC